MHRPTTALAFLLLAACSGNADRSPAPREAAPPPVTPTAGQPTAGQPLILSVVDPASAVTAHTGASDLVRRFGAAQVQAGDVDLGEGETAPGTILFPTDSLRRVEIVWADSSRSAPQRVEVQGAASRWTVPPGISLGVSLDSLERLNGRPFHLYGFGWDYEGTVSSWDGGRLAALDGDSARVLVRLAPTNDDSVPDSVSRTVAGEQVFSSDNPVIRRLRPRVYDILLQFGR